MSSRVPVYEDDTGKLELEIREELVFLHYTSYKFNHTVYKQTLDKLEFIQDGLMKLGVTYLYSCIHKDDTLTRKFQNMFGLTQYLQNEDLVIYRKKL